MKLVCYSPDKKIDWDHFVEQSKNGLFMFRRDYMDYHADRFEDHSLMVYTADNKLVALLPANKKDDVLHSHQGLSFGGFISGNDMKAALMLEIFEALKAYLAAHGFSKMIYKVVPYIYHRQPAQEDLYALYRNEARLFRMDISTVLEVKDRLPFAELRKRGVKKAVKNGVTISENSNYAGFMDVLAEVLQARHGIKPVHSTAEIEMLVARFPDNIKLYTAQKDDVILGGTLVFEYPHLAHAQYIASSFEGKESGALDMVFHHLLNTVYADKKYFSFGVSSEEAGQILNEGLINQKEGFGGRTTVHEFFELTINA